LKETIYSNTAMSIFFKFSTKKTGWRLVEDFEYILTSFHLKTNPTGSKTNNDDVSIQINLPLRRWWCRFTSENNFFFL